MFTGIITDLGRVRQVERRGDARFVFETAYDTGEIAPGASIACSGACLTVVDKGPGWFAADVSAETLSKTTLGDWRPGAPVNLERALKLGDELGGHLVSGHVDGVAEVVSRRPEGESQRFRFRAPAALAAFVAPKGSLALDGVSLTVNEVEDEAGGAVRFGVNIVPHTAERTTFGGLEAGARVNLEIDLLARYVQRLRKREG
jgi:riboflavin synthase